MELVMKIKNIKGINEFDFSFPLDKGIYAITGENGSGKSTLISCASTVFYSMPMYEHFGRPKDAVIEFDINGANLSIFFSTHSLELLREIKAQNIYYLTKMFDGCPPFPHPYHNANL